MRHKAGYINAIGYPNVGKSTIINALANNKLSIVTEKAQTTRKRILSLVNDENYQIVFSDLPGVISKPFHALHQYMMKYVDMALEDADVFMFVTDQNEQNRNVNLIEKIKSLDVPVIPVINKTDLCSANELDQIRIDMKKLFPGLTVIETSAKKNTGFNVLLKKIIELLPISPPYYPKDQLSDKSDRFFVSEIIREKILTHYQKEIPYAVEVQIDSYKDEAKILRIKAVIFVERESQKVILIGHKGSNLKKVGTEARLSIEKYADKKVFLELFVKVKKNWRKDQNALKWFGYLD